MNNFFKKIGAKKINHVAVATYNINKVVQDWLSLPNSKLISKPLKNRKQGVNCAFVQLSNNLVIEILSPLGKKSPISKHLKRGGGVYHFCFDVDNIFNSIKLADNLGAKLISKPLNDIAFNNRKVSFLFHSDHGLFELLETKKNKNNSLVEKAFNRNKLDSNKLNKLHGIFLEIFPKIKGIKKDKMKINCIDKWDSLGHLQLIMAIEKKLNIKIPSSKLDDLDSFDKIYEFLKNR